MATGLTDHDRPGAPLPDLSPEARRKEALRHKAGLTEQVTRRVGPGTRFYEIVSRVLVGAWNDGFIHAGNLAYMSVLAIFPFFITGAALFSLAGEPGERAAAINTILVALPPVVGGVIRPVALGVIDQSSGWLLWIGGLVGLWTVGSLIETIRDILRRAYGTRATRAFWWYRLLSSGIIVAAVVLVMLSLIAQFAIGAAQQVIAVYAPRLYDAIDDLSLARFVPAVVLFASLYLLFYSLTPAAYRKRRYPKWPGVLLVTVWWAGVTTALPPLLHGVFRYDTTYGSLAGIMIVLFFFWLVGLGMVMGAELNAALAVTPEEEEDRIDHADDRAQAHTTNLQEREEASR
jgi:membrane protein